MAQTLVVWIYKQVKEEQSKSRINYRNVQVNVETLWLATNGHKKIETSFPTHNTEPVWLAFDAPKTSRAQACDNPARHVRAEFRFGVSDVVK
ncbi:MAG: hypothetical protein B6D41_16255 [Chloroflexi bacterium UTCFX4]|nr:MAG: hypothetical protein B6D41_16255 [Chloroflexi bacterium UTCFX4]